MAELTEKAEWTDGIYQLETSDPVVGGPGGISNRQAQELAYRTRYLKDNLDATSAGLAQHEAAADPHTQYAPKLNPTFSGMPKAPTPASDSNSDQLATTAFVKSVVAALVDGSPAALDTLKELSVALGNDPHFATTITNSIAQKAPLNSPALSGIPTAPTAEQSVNTTQIATTAFVKSAINALVDGSPAALDTLKELSAALGNDANFAATVTNSLSGKMEKSQNGADIPDKARFLENLGLGEGSALPVGTPIPWPSATVPAGWLQCNGSSFTAAQYPKLAQAYPGLKLPDLRGEFIRGWDSARGIDSGRSLLTVQEASWIQPNIETNPEATAIGFGDGERPFNTDVQGAASGISISGNSGSRARAYVRPRNIAFNYIVRAA
ncbi:phage tail protein [Lonsdalea quercina]|uniref:phage tail protein n=1 Tax=Lonsdalea quercina TaxID=71657 RepID=UPI003975E508